MNREIDTLNEGFFDWIKGLLKNLVGSVFHVNNYEKFIERINKFPNIILGIENNTEDSNESVSESYYVPKRSRKRLYEGRSRFAKPILEDDTDVTDNDVKDVSTSKSDTKDDSTKKDDIKKMSKEDYVNVFQPITYDDLDKNTKTPSFKNVLIKKLDALNKSRVQLEEKFTPAIKSKIQRTLSSGKTIAMSDIQVLEIFVSDFLNLYSSGTLGLPKVEKDKKMTISELSQYKNVVDKADPSKKFSTLYNELNKVIKTYEDSFNSEWEFIRTKEEEYEKRRADNASWDGDGEVSYETIQKISDNEMEVSAAIDSIIEGCRDLIPNAIAGFFINSPIYKDTETQINELLKYLIENEKVLEENKKNPDLKVISVLSDIIGHNIEESDKENINKAYELYNTKVSNLLNKYKDNDLKIVNIDSVDNFIKLLENSNLKITKNETMKSLLNKINNDNIKLAIACLYNVYTSKTFSVEYNIPNVGKIDLFKESYNYRSKELKNLYDLYGKS